MKKKFLKKSGVKHQLHNQSNDPAPDMVQEYLLSRLINPMDGPGILEEDLRILEKYPLAVSTNDTQPITNHFP